MMPLFDPSLDPLFWDSLRPASPSAWHGHVPFAHWLVAATQPRLVVELGTHAGVSYAAFCQAVLRGGLSTRCVAVDTWAGDDHAGAYSEEVFAELRAFHDTHFAGFSRMLRATFDDTVHEFADGSIDLLHIDGFHTYEAVSHDFHTWRAKLSDRAVVLFHDTNVHERDFGVWKFWAEIKDSGVGSLEFLHAFGLGVLMVGPHAPEALRALRALCDAPIAAVRSRFTALGERFVLGHALALKPATVPEPPPATAPPPVDTALDPGTIAIAERVVAPPGMSALRLPRDAVTRNETGCTVWVVSADGQSWRRGSLTAAPKGAVVTLVFAPFANTTAQHFHLFVTDLCPAGTGLPQALADGLSSRRPPIGLDTPHLAFPDLPPHGLFLLEAGKLELCV